MAALSSAAALFVVFRLGVDVVSVALVGIWSLIQGLMLVARVGDSGAGTNVTRVMAVRFKAGIPQSVRSLTSAAIAISSGPTILLATAVAPLIGVYVADQFSGAFTPAELWGLVWLSLVNAVIAALAGVLLAVCEGAFKLRLKNYAIIVGNVVALLVAYPLLLNAGPLGIGYIYIAMSTTQLLIAVAQIVQLARADGPTSRTFRNEVRELWKENLGLTGVALIRLSFEPVTKLLLSVFAGLNTIAFFELALRVATQIRVLIQASLQPLLALGARMRDAPAEHLHDLFHRNDRALVVVATGSFIAQMFAAPFVGVVGLGAYSTEFILFFSILALGNTINVTGLAGYYFELSSGALKFLIHVQIFMAVANVVVGLSGLAAGDPRIVVLGYSFAFALGGVLSRSRLPGVSLFSSVGTAVFVAVLAAPLFAGLLAFDRLGFVASALLAGFGSLIGLAALLMARRSFK